MNYEDLRKAQADLRLTDNQFADMLGISADRLRKMKSAPKSERHVKLSDAVARLVQIYHEFGYRPPDWPMSE